MSIIETDFKCAGMCQLSDFYLFTDVNKGIPPHTCKQALSDQIEKIAYKNAVQMTVLGALGFFGVSFAICLYNILNKKKYLPLFQANPSTFWRNKANSNREVPEADAHIE